MLYEGIHCRVAVERPASGVAVLKLTGWDIGEFGDAPMKELEKAFPPEGRLALFIDARAVKGVSVDVSSEWAQWLQKHRARFAHVSMLTGGPYVKLTAKFVQRFAALSEVMRIYTDAAAFDAELRKMGSDPITARKGV